jgi:RNA polymerase sigma factor (sigma-70 family)
MPQKKARTAKAAESRAKPKRKVLSKKKAVGKKAVGKKASRKKVAEKPPKKVTEEAPKEKPTFEESIDDIDREIAKRRNKWNLTVLAWMDFQDVSQILRIHIYKKWHLYDPEKPLGPWINRIISNQIKNLIRNNYGNYARPCLRCAAAEGGELCSIYTKQCNDCPLYSNWEKSKKRAHDAKLPVSLEDHHQEVHSMPSDTIDIEKIAKKLHKKMKSILKPVEWSVYKYLYVEQRSEEEAAKLMGYRTSEKGRQPGYKQIKNIKKSIIAKVKKILYKDEIDFL